MSTTSESGPPAEPPPAHLVTLSNAVAIPLGTALVSHIATVHGIRAIVIKGLVVEQLGLRPARPYADIDVIVEPGRFDDYVEALGAAGWHERAHLWVFDHLDEHSLTLIHPSWPVDIDLHRYFPGFLAPADSVFDELWQRRQHFVIAGQQVIGSDAPSAASVLALHALRWMHNDRNREEYRLLVSWLASRPESVDALRRLAARTGSSETLGPLFDELGVEPEPGEQPTKAALASWRRRAAHPSRTGQWVTYLLHSPLRAWPRELRAILWPPRELYHQDHPDVADTPSALFAARIKRIGNGAAGVTQIIRAAILRGRSGGGGRRHER